MVENAAPVLMSESEPNRGELPPKGEEEEESRRRDDAALATDAGASESNATGESPPKGELTKQVNYGADFGGDQGRVLKVGEEGLKKKVLKEGEGWETPEVGDEVEVHYTGTLLDGTKFDSSHDRGGPFKFKLGQGQVLQGFSQCIKTMKKGENAVFTIAPLLAYGASGSLPAIPSNETLQFDVELLSWTSIKDICKDGGVLKKILKEGDKWETPKDPDEVLVKYEARLENGTAVSKSEAVEFIVKDGYFCPALAKAVKTMKKEEKVSLTVKPQYGFGDKGRPEAGEEHEVPPNATLLIDLELLSWKSTVTEIGDDKKILTKDLKKGVVVEVKTTGKLQDVPVFMQKEHDEEPLKFKTDEDLQLCLQLPKVEGQRPTVFHLTNPMQQSLSEAILCQPLLQSDTESTVIKLKLIKGSVLIESIELEGSVDGNGEESMFNLSVLINFEKQQVVLSFFDKGNWRSTNIYSMVPLLNSKPAEHSDDSTVCYKGFCSVTSIYPLDVDFKKDFVVSEPIGEGTYGSVYKCSKHDVQIAIKKMRKACTASKIPCSEVESMIRLAGSQHVVQIYSAWIEESASGQSYVYIAMELFQRNLDDYLTERTEFDLPYNRQIFTEIMLGVSSMHQAGIIHRDLKPTNILLDSHGHASIADFGMSKLIPKGTAAVRFSGYPTYGTKYYTDPDLNDGPYNEKVDIYSAGIIYLEMNFLTQRRKHVREFDSKYKRSLKSKELDLWNSSMWQNWEGDKQMMKDMVSRPGMNRPDSSYFLENLQAAHEA